MAEETPPGSNINEEERQKLQDRIAVLKGLIKQKEQEAKNPENAPTSASFRELLDLNEQLRKLETKRDQLRGDGE